MAEIVNKPIRPYIEQKPGVCGGSPVIVGTRFTVRAVAVYVLEHGMTPEDLVRDFPHLTLAQIHDALSYYYDHKEEVDHDIEANKVENVRKHFSDL